MDEKALGEEVAREIAEIMARLRATTDDAETACAREIARLVVDRAQLRADLAALKAKE